MKLWKLCHMTRPVVHPDLYKRKWRHQLRDFAFVRLQMCKEIIFVVGGGYFTEDLTIIYVLRSKFNKINQH